MSTEARMFALAIGGIALLTVMDAIAKALAADYGTFQIAFARFAFSALWVGAAALVVRPGWPRRDRLAAHGLRALLMVTTTSAFFYAIGHLPLAEVFVLTYTAPIFVALFGALLLGEKVDRITVAAIACGFAGVVWVALGDAQTGDGAPRPWFALACAIACPVTYALGNVLLRAQTAHEHVVTIVLTQSLLASALLLPAIVAAQATLPTLHGGLMFAALGLFGAGGYLAFASAIAKLPAARVAVADYSGLIWAALLGYLLFAEVPKPSLWAGAVLILGGSLLMLRAKKPKTA